MGKFRQAKTQKMSSVSLRAEGVAIPQKIKDQKSKIKMTD
jgi:hypothetical protein